LQALLTIPVHLGGLGLANQTTVSSSSYQASRKLTRPLVEAIASQDVTNSIDVSETAQFRIEIHNNNCVQHNQELCTPVFLLTYSFVLNWLEKKALHCGCQWFWWRLKVMASTLTRVIFMMPEI